ncbi:MAG: divergent PAP2 family protein [Bacillota bacterium]|nr:divergent PAP2 family protein [Bacillota bacterium]
MKGVGIINNDSVVQQIQNNEVLIVSILAWAIAQFLKIVTWALISKKVNFRRLVEPGGMPSSHSAFVTSLATGIGIKEGFSSTLFALAMVFSLIVMYDAAGVRRAAGKQATVLNSIIEDLNRRELHPERLKELLGHTPVEVVIGALLGIAVAIWRL